MESLLNGIIPPLLTPMNAAGELDTEGLKRLINHCIAGGVNGIFIAGSCGEGSVITRKLRKQMVRETNRIVDGRVPVLTGVLESSALKVIEDIKELEAEGLTYTVAAPPFYLESTGQAEILRHYSLIAQRTKTKIVVYNIPPFVHTRIMPETMAELFSMDSVIALKDSTQDWADFQKTLRLKEENGFTLLSGSEDLCGAGMLFGADGCVPCLANIFPELYVDMYRAAKNKNVEGVFGFQKRIMNLRSAFAFGKSWIGVAKYICSCRGIIEDSVSVTMELLTGDQKKQIRSIIDEELQGKACS